MKVLEIPMSGKRGNRVWQSNRFCQYSYPAFTPFNPKTPAQTAVRGAFGAVSARWRELDQAQRDVWCAVARTMKSKPRLQQCGPLTGFLLFVKVNVPLANRGLAQVDLPPEGRSEKQDCRNKPPKAVPDLLDRVFVSTQCAGRRGIPLRYRSSPILPPYHHRSTTLAGRWGRRCPQKRLRFPCRSQPVA
jgi:hypothetical protein